MADKNTEVAVEDNGGMKKTRLLLRNSVRTGKGTEHAKR